MANQLKINIHDIDIGTKHLVYGYIRAVEKSEALIIPQSIVFICLAFYYFADDYFELACSSFDISEDRKTITKTVLKYDSSACGHHKIPSQNGGVFTWTFRIIERYTSMYIGITTDLDNTQMDAWKNSNGTTCAMSTTGSGIVNQNRSAYSGAFRKGDTVKMILDLNTQTLRYHINDIAHDVMKSDLPIGADVKYQMVVTMLNKRSQLTLVDFSAAEFW